MKTRRLSVAFFCPMYSASRVGRRDNSNCRSSSIIAALRTLKGASSSDIEASDKCGMMSDELKAFGFHSSFITHHSAFCTPRSSLRQVAQAAPEQQFDRQIAAFVHGLSDGFFGGGALIAEIDERRERVVVQGVAGRRGCAGLRGELFFERGRSERGHLVAQV